MDTTTICSHCGETINTQGAARMSADLLPGQMTVAQLRDYLDAAGVDYRTRDRKEHLAYMARQVRYERDYVARGNAAGERDTGSMRAFQGGNADGF